MPVHFSYLSFGIGTISHPIGSTKVTVGVKGSSDQPAYASATWKTPAAPGHYCIQVLLDPVDDLNSANNLGQENTTVGAAHSPALFTFELRNNTRRVHRYSFRVDTYALGVRLPCSEVPQTRDAAVRQRLLSPHRAGGHPLPAGWKVEFDPETPSLAPEESMTMKVSVTPPAGFTGGQPINVNAIREDDVVAGGVTLTVVAEP